MQTTPVDSSHLKSIGYEPESQTLTVEFHKGGIYHYHNVPPQKYEQLMNADSHGKYFLNNIKNSHPVKKA